MNGYDIQAETGVAIITCPECNAHFPDVEKVCPECKNETVSYWITCNNLTFSVTTSNKIIVDTAPIVSKFIGQPLSNLVGWLLGAGKSVEVKKL